MTPREQLVVGFFGLAIIAGSLTAVWLNRASDAAAPEPGAVEPQPASTALPSKPAAPAAVPAEAAPESPEEIVVSIQGAVQRPGVYSMQADDRVNHLIDRAGGPTHAALMDDINLAARLIDGSTLTIPERDKPVVRDGVVTLRGRTDERVPNPPQYTLSGWADGAPRSASFSTERMVESSAETQPAAQPATVGGRIDLNRATAQQLEELPGIGPVLAQSIVNYRSNVPFTSVEDLQNVRGIGPGRFEAVRDLVTVVP